MAGPMKARARMQGGYADVRVLMSHPMETGLRTDSKTGEKIPAHHITEVSAEHNGKQQEYQCIGPQDDRLDHDRRILGSTSV